MEIFKKQHKDLYDKKGIRCHQDGNIVQRVTQSNETNEEDEEKEEREKSHDDVPIPCVVKDMLDIV